MCLLGILNGGSCGVMSCRLKVYCLLSLVVVVIVLGYYVNNWVIFFLDCRCVLFSGVSYLVVEFSDCWVWMVVIVIVSCLCDGFVKCVLVVVMMLILKCGVSLVSVVLCLLLSG